MVFKPTQWNKLNAHELLSQYRKDQILLAVLILRCHITNRSCQCIWKHFAVLSICLIKIFQHTFSPIRTQIITGANRVGIYMLAFSQPLACPHTVLSSRPQDRLVVREWLLGSQWILGQFAYEIPCVLEIIPRSPRIPKALCTVDRQLLGCMFSGNLYRNNLYIFGTDVICRYFQSILIESMT